MTNRRDEYLTMLLRPFALIEGCLIALWQRLKRKELSDRERLYYGTLASQMSDTPGARRRNEEFRL